MQAERPYWWCYPENCKYGHVWKPGTISVSWVKCLCPGNQEGGHLRVSCRTDRCPSVWYQPPHKPGSEITGRPG